MKSFELLHQILDLLQVFEKENEKATTLRDFTGFLLSRQELEVIETNGNEVRFGDSEPEAQQIAFQLDNDISRLLIFMSRYAKSYLKKALAGTALQTPEDFTCLAILLTHDHLSKKELIHYNIQQKTSGSVIITRLAHAGLILESDSETSKKGKNISITAEGRSLLYRVFEHTSRAGKIITGRLTLKEKLLLQQLLQKLEAFHYPIYAQKQVQSKEDLEKIARSI